MSSQRSAQNPPHFQVQVSAAHPALSSPSSHGHPGPSTQIDGSLQQGSESQTEGNDVLSCTWNKRTERNQRRMTIDILIDDVLLEIFDFLVVQFGIQFWTEGGKWWRTLVHVCRRWRNVIFGSSHRLNLRLLCLDKTPVREILDVWPPLPIAIYHFGDPKSGWDSIIAALEHNDRVREITLKLDTQWEKVLDTMQEPFTALTHLILTSVVEITPVISDSFMSGSAPRLQYLLFDHFLIPGLPKLLSSTTDLVRLILCHIPHSGYISPEEIATCLTMLPRLEFLLLEFKSPQSRPNGERRHLPSPTRSVLPRLIRLHFSGVSEYLEDLVARIDCPQLRWLKVILFHLLVFDTSQFIQFISRTPILEIHDEACVEFSDSRVGVTFSKASSPNYGLTLSIICRKPEWQLSSTAQICTSFLPQSFIRMIERLSIRKRSSSKLEWQDGIEDSKWLELFHPFTAVKDLHLSKDFGPRIAPSLQGLVGERTTEVLPALQSLSLAKPHQSGPYEEAIEKFVAARQLSNHPVSISWRRTRV